MCDPHQWNQQQHQDKAKVGDGREGKMMFLLKIEAPSEAESGKRPFPFDASDVKSEKSRNKRRAFMKCFLFSGFDVLLFFGHIGQSLLFHSTLSNAMK